MLELGSKWMVLAQGIEVPLDSPLGHYSLPPTTWLVLLPESLLQLQWSWARLRIRRCQQSP